MARPNLEVEIEISDAFLHRTGLITAGDRDAAGLNITGDPDVTRAGLITAGDPDVTRAGLIAAGDPDATRTGLITFGLSYNELSELITSAAKAAYSYSEFSRVRGESEVFIMLTGDDEIRIENERMRGIDSPTDVLSFPIAGCDLTAAGADPFDINPDTGRVMLGDIIISVERAVAQSAEYGHSFERELAFLAVHGMLHLTGYDHTEAGSEEEMFGLQKKIMEDLGY